MANVKGNGRIIVTTLAALSVPFLFWLGGFNFDQRGAGAVMCCLLTASAAALAWVGWEVW